MLFVAQSQRELDEGAQCLQRHQSIQVMRGPENHEDRNKSFFNNIHSRTVFANCLLTAQSDIEAHIGSLRSHGNSPLPEMKRPKLDDSATPSMLLRFLQEEARENVKEEGEEHKKECG